MNVRKKPMNLEAAKKIFLEVHNILSEVYIDIFLSDGTMLGAVREKSFIPWDYDIDSRVAFSRWNFSVFDELEKNDYECRISINSRYRGLVSGVNFVKQGIDFGIGFNYYYPPEDVVIFLAGKPSLPSHIQPASYYRGEHFIDFLGIKVRIPHPPIEYLERLYGKGWKTPVKDKSWQSIRKRISLEKYLTTPHALMRGIPHPRGLGFLLRSQNQRPDSAGLTSHLSDGTVLQIRKPATNNSLTNKMKNIKRNKCLENPEINEAK